MRIGLMLGLAFAASPALGGDIAQIQPLGFSEDGKVFAYEQFGIQDGSGFKYSEIYLIDTVKDAYLPGSPFRVRKEDEAIALGPTRAENLAKAAASLASHHIADNYGELVAFNSAGELDSDPRRLRYRPILSEPAFAAPYTLQLAEISGLDPANCKDFGVEVEGFSLTLTERDGKPANDLVYKDDRIPEGRHCPSGYRLGGVMTYAPPTGPSVHIALILVWSLGFEGADGRWIAVPVHP